MALTLGRGTTVHADSMPEQEGSTRCGRDSEMIKATGAEVTCKTCLKALAKDEAQDIDRIADEILTDRAGTWPSTVNTGTAPTAAPHGTPDYAELDPSLPQHWTYAEIFNEARGVFPSSLMITLGAGDSADMPGTTKRIFPWTTKRIFRGAGWVKYLAHPDGGMDAYPGPTVTQVSVYDISAAPTEPVRYVEQPELMDRIRKLAARSAGTPGYASEPRRFRAGPAGKRGTHGRRHR